VGIGCGGLGESKNFLFIILYQADPRYRIMEDREGVVDKQLDRYA
jgi:hypothetical protein